MHIKWKRELKIEKFCKEIYSDWLFFGYLKQWNPTQPERNFGNTGLHVSIMIHKALIWVWHLPWHYSQRNLESKRLYRKIWNDIDFNNKIFCWLHIFFWWLITADAEHHEFHTWERTIPPGLSILSIVLGKNNQCILKKFLHVWIEFVVKRRLKKWKRCHLHSFHLVLSYLERFGGRCW